MLRQSSGLVALALLILACDFSPRPAQTPAPVETPSGSPRPTVEATPQPIATDTAQPAGPETFGRVLPFLPLFNAVQIYRIQVRYLDSQNGAGVRYLTLYGQDFRVPNNQELLYTYQGLSQDGAFYVAMVLPVSHPSLPAEGAVPPDQFAAFNEDYDAYVEAVEQSLEGLAPTSFIPDLTMLDAMVQLLEVR